jgi:hypothetical protein
MKTLSESFRIASACENCKWLHLNGRFNMSYCRKQKAYIEKIANETAPFGIFSTICNWYEKAQEDSF